MEMTVINAAIAARMLPAMFRQQLFLPPEPHGGADEVNLHVCRRMKAKRILRNMSQERLAKALGISYQQLQRYESGKSRLPSSLLYRAALALEVAAGYFFEGLPAGRAGCAEPGLDKAVLLVARDIQCMPDDDMRKALLDLIVSLATLFPAGRGSKGKP